MTIRIKRFSAILFLLSVGLHTSFAQQVQVNTTSNYACQSTPTVLNGTAVFWLQSGTNCTYPNEPRVLNPSNWQISGGPYTITYLPGGSNPVTYNAIQLVFLGTGTYTIGVTYDCGGSSNSAQPKSIQVYQSFTPTVQIQTNNATICEGVEPALFTAIGYDGGVNPTTSPNPTYTWMINGNNVTGQSGPTFTTTSLQDGDQVSVQFNSNRYCMFPSYASTSMPLTIGTVEPTPVSVQIESSKQVVNVGDPIKFTANISGAIAAPTIQWTINGASAPASTMAVGPNELGYTSWAYSGSANVQCIVTTAETCTLPRPAYSNTLNVYGCANLPATNPTITTEQMICAVKFSAPMAQYPNCKAHYLWNFGDNTTSTEPSPVHMYNVTSTTTFNTSLTVTYNCVSCQTTRSATKSVTFVPSSDNTVPKTVVVLSDLRPGVLATSASTFSDSWPVDHYNNALDLKSGYQNGSLGVWRNDASYAYQKDRQQSTPVNLAQDGVFDLEMFNWKQAEVNAIPGWIQATEITRYSPYGFELENRDVLDVYSAAIYDYGGQLPVANGVNLKSDEIAFTSFEHFEGPVAGNWIIAPAGSSIPAYETYTIQSGNKNMAVIEAPLSTLQNVTTVDVISNVREVSGQPFYGTFTQSNYIVCLKAYPGNASWSIVVFGKAPFEGLWKGQVRIKKIVTVSGSSATDNAVFHSGKTSLKVVSTATYKQELLRLTPGKAYWVTGWVSINNPAVMSDAPIASVGIEIISKSSAGAQLAITPTISPAGPVIEGWQQFRYVYTPPANTAYIEVKFLGYSTGAYYDDLRIQPEEANMKCYVYNKADYRLQAILDEENFASYFYYDKEGNLYLTKKETLDGIKTLSENISFQIER